MNHMLKIQDINQNDFISGKLENELPEFYKLKNVIENSRSFHKNDSVFDHSLRVLNCLNELLIDQKYPELDQPVDNYSRKDLLILATLLHDIGKQSTLVYKDGFTSAPGHGEAGVAMLPQILSRFDLSDKEKSHVSHLVLMHQAFFDVVSSTDPELATKIAKVSEQEKPYLPELILLAIADISGSQLQQTNREEYLFRINYLKGLLMN